jgi:hypothetical protein
MQEYDEAVDDHVEDEAHTIEESGEELLEEDEISSREEAFLKGYDDAIDMDHEENEDEEPEE